MWCSCCEPCKWCGNGGSLSNHRDAVERAAAASEAAAAQTAAMQAMVEACGQAQVASEALEDKIARMVEGVEQSHLNSCADMHLRHFLPQNAVARHKEALTSILVAQTAAIKASLEGKLREGCDIDEVIGPIMAATDKFRSSACEHRARAASYPANTQVTPQLRKLKAADGSTIRKGTWVVDAHWYKCISDSQEARKYHLDSSEIVHVTVASLVQESALEFLRFSQFGCILPDEAHLAIMRHNFSNVIA